MKISVQKSAVLKEKPDSSILGFGNYFTDHMFAMDYTEGAGWLNPRIIPYAPISLEPSAMVFHYGQAIFEGLKAYKAKDDRVLLFRPLANMERINVSNCRMCIPPVDPEFCLQALFELLRLEKDWIPEASGTSLYIRPFIIATDPFIGVRPSQRYTYYVILSPVGAYYPTGLDPVKIYIETNYVRAVKGGTGFAKTPANYAASLKAQMEAKEKGYTQVLWLDGIHKKYIEEVGTMNVFFVIDGEIITPALNGSILPGITRSSVIELLSSWGREVVEREISIEEVYDAHKSGKLEEAFGTGTAAVISPIGELDYNGDAIMLSNGNIGPLSQQLYDSITNIQLGETEDTLGWVVELQ